MPIYSTFKAKWLWYSVLCVICWGGWAMCSKLGSTQIPAKGMQFLFTIGTLPVALFLVVARRFKFEKSPRGIFYGVANGILSGVGGLALFAAYRSGGNTAVITAVTSLYPMITVGLAVLILRERVNWRQALGLAFAAIAIVIFSLEVG
ncbi:MAG TPA: DMT family transporter [Terriglobia bacterium]|nr:DMT family transporter [Terriglobia bacterium]